MHETADRIRPLRPEDRPAWQALWADYNAFYGRSGETALPPSVIESSWHRLLDPSEPVFGLVAEHDGRLLGLAHFLFHRNMIQIADTCYLQDLFTAPEARGRGIAGQLIEAVGTACLERGVNDIYWHTQESNAAARALYDRVARDTRFLVYRRPAVRG